VIIGDDNRRQITDLTAAPHSGICLIQARYDHFPDVIGRGTGFLVGPRRLATAGHVLWNDVESNATRNVLPDRLEIFLGEGFYAGHDNLVFTLEPAADVCVVHPDFVAGNDDMDLGRIDLPATSVAPLPVLGFPADLQIGESLTISGFPADLRPFRYYEGDGPLRDIAGPVFRHQVDTTEGQSGSAVRVARAGAWRVVGVHLGDAGQDMNRALALTGNLAGWLLD
jgi:V8-like Glu-specific endopeptidase